MELTQEQKKIAWDAFVDAYRESGIQPVTCELVYAAVSAVLTRGNGDEELWKAALERERVHLEQLAALSWTPITPENLPKVGDEILAACEAYANVRNVDAQDMRVGWEERRYWTHFRPIAPPAVPPVTQTTGESEGKHE
jgi:hypothetical protein